MKSIKYKNDDGTIFPCYTSASELHVGTANKAMKHIYLAKSMDNGTNWTEPVDFTPDYLFTISENAFPTIADRVDENVHVVFQRDYEPGIHVSGEEHTVSTNDIVYLRADSSLTPPLNPGVNELILNSESAGYFLSIFNF